MNRLSVLVPFVAVACATGHRPAQSGEMPGVVLTHSIAEGSGDAVDPDGPPRPRRTTPPAAPVASAPTVNAAPDPDALRLAEQWEYELAWNQGEIQVTRVTSRVFPQPIVTARRMGRFAIELWIGPELVERVRFDFPMLALEDDPQAVRSTPSLSRGAQVTARVLVPSAPRARRAVLVDRASERRTPLPWPPQPLAPAAAAAAQ